MGQLSTRRLLRRSAAHGPCGVKLTNPEAWGHYNTPLHHALYGSRYDIDGARLLLQRGADIDQMNSVGRTALHEAVLGQRTKVVKFLLEAGAGLGRRTEEAHSCVTETEEELEGRSGELAWEYALWNSDVTILKMLLQAGVDVRSRTWTALGLAIWAGDERVVEALLEFDRTLIDGPMAWTRTEDTDLVQSSREFLKPVNSKASRPPYDLYAAYCSAFFTAGCYIHQG
jgi:ankyrin repeat protein